MKKRVFPNRITGLLAGATLTGCFAFAASFVTADAFAR
jgi:hypothetical protein